MDIQGLTDSGHFIYDLDEDLIKPYLYICSYTDERGGYWGSAGTMSGRLNVDINIVKDWIKRLERKSLIKKIYHGDHLHKIVAKQFKSFDDDQNY